MPRKRKRPHAAPHVVYHLRRIVRRELRRDMPFAVLACGHVVPVDPALDRHARFQPCPQCGVVE